MSSVSASQHHTVLRLADLIEAPAHRGSDISFSAGAAAERMPLCSAGDNDAAAQCCRLQQRCPRPWAPTPPVTESAHALPRLPPSESLVFLRPQASSSESSQRVPPPRRPATQAGSVTVPPAAVPRLPLAVTVLQWARPSEAVSNSLFVLQLSLQVVRVRPRPRPASPPSQFGAGGCRVQVRLSLRPGLGPGRPGRGAGPGPCY
eukprot:951484-Rhodomonas_salina.1